MAQTYHFYWLDVFTQHVFGGNQLAVFPDAQGLSDAQMQQIAREFNISETVFLFPPQTPAGTRRARIFTPGRELPFAGHPTIGAVHVLATVERGSQTSPPREVVLEELVGLVRVSIQEQGDRGGSGGSGGSGSGGRSAGSSGDALFIQLSAARAPEFREVAAKPETFAAPLRLEPADLQSDLPIGLVSCGTPFLILPVRNADALRRARLDADAWQQLVATGVLGTTDSLWTNHVYPVTNDPSLRPADLRVRMFAPDLGVVEDPATGSAATTLAAHLARLSSQRDGTLKWTVEQGIEMGRPSTLYLEADKRDGEITAVRVGGYAVIASEGRFTLP
jgi:trans-2,3-dihydro-3-hydroxyanthranilate isomerase